MDRVSSQLSLLASVGMFEPLLCLGVETRSWEKTRVAWLGELVLGKWCCALQVGGWAGTGCFRGQDRIEDSVPWVVKGF